MELAIIRQVLKRAAESGSYASLAEALGFAPVEHPIDFLSDASSEAAQRLQPLVKSLSRIGAFESGHAHAGLWIAVLAEWGDRNTTRERARRRLAKVLVEIAPAGDRNVLLILTTEDVGDIEIVLPRRRSNGSLGTVRALVSRSDPTRHHLELLESLILKPGDETAIIMRRWSDAFNVERVTKSFYLEFRALRDRLVEAMKSENPGNALISPADDDEVGQSDLRRYVTRNLGRMLFLWFIQSKHWLDGDAYYLLNLYNTRCRAGRDHNFFRESLIPLFFDALAKKPGDRPRAAQLLGELPYLNGGLFIQTAFEDRLYGDEREHIDVTIPNSLFDARVHDAKTPTVLGLLSSYRFTTRESTPDDQSVDPDPELLGKVFENLNEERKKTGTYYTPREVVRFMCREALDGYLRDVAGVTDETLAALRLKALDPEATDIRLSVEERKRLEEALLGVKVCDPAVGSGAFPVGMLQEMIQFLIGIEQSTDVAVSVGGQRVAEWKEQVITNCLYGVDINPEAVEICHLRLWLSMVIDADRPVPLPNLDFRFEAGDSLVDRVADLPLLDSLPTAKQSALALGSVSDALQKLEHLRSEYALTDDPMEARHLRAAIKEAQLDTVRAQLDELIDQCKRAVKGSHTRLDELRQLGAQATHTRGAQKRAEDMRRRVEELEQFRDNLSPEAPYKKPFLWPVEFSEVFENGGFDIVVANPPYVRQEKISPIDQLAYAAAFHEVHTGTADLLVYFFARAIQIMKENGRLAFITSNKFQRAGYGEGLREHLPKVMAIGHIIDFGDLAVFDAIAYPSILIGAKRSPEIDRKTIVARLTHAVRRELAEAGVTENVATVREKLEDLNGLLDRNGVVNFPQALLRPRGWILENPGLVRLFDRLMEMGTPLGEFVQGRMYRGVLTGLNEAFVIDEEKRAELNAADPRSAELIKPWLRGKDIKRWRPEWAGLYLIAIQNSGDAGNQNPWGHAKSEREALKLFRETYPAIHDHISGFEERLRPRADQGRWWWELRACTYYAKFDRPKVIWPDIGPAARMAWDSTNAFLGNTAYMIPTEHPWLVPLLNSHVILFCMGLSSTMVRGGYLRFIDSNVSPLPIVAPPGPAQERLSEIALSAAADGPNELLEAEVNDIVYGLYELRAPETSAVNTWIEENLSSTDDTEELIPDE